MRSLGIGLVMVALLGALWTLWGARAVGAPAPKDPHVVVLYTSQISGELEPCGCTTGPLGGFPYRGPMVERVRSEGHPTVILDAGDLLLKEGLSLDEVTGDGRARARLLLDLIERHGAQALAVGPRDVSAVGVDGLKALAAGRKIKLLSANLTDDRGRRVFDASAVLTAGGYRVGVIGVTGEGLGIPGVDTPARTLPAADVVAAEARRLRPQVDLLLALSNLDEPGNEALAAAVGELDFILAGPRDNPLDSGAGLYDADGRPPFLVPLGSQGRFLGRLDVLMGGPQGARPSPAPELGASLRRERIARERLAELDARIVEEEGTSNPERLARQGASLMSQIDAAQASRDAPRGQPGFFFAALPVTRGATVDTVAAERIAAFKVEQAERVAVAAREATPIVSFAGTASCRGCHPLQTAHWLGTRHASAFETLERIGRGRDPACIGCHTTGYGQPGGFLTPSDVRGHEDVGCEACHGPMSDHPTRRRFVTPTSAATCLRCHDAANSPGFDYAASRGGITCPAGVTTPGGLVGETAH